jgi:MYXO-CTERM domain-containing protein
MKILWVSGKQAVELFNGSGFTGFAGDVVSTVPEPSTIALGLVSVAGLGMVRLVRRRKP